MKNFILNILSDIYWRHRMLTGYYGFRVWKDAACLDAIRKQTDDMSYVMDRHPDWLNKHLGKAYHYH